MTEKGKKAAETRRKNEAKMLREMGVKPRAKTKVKRRRKQMTDAQRQAAAERLQKAREARGITGAASVHESIRDMDEESALHWKKVKGWIKSCQEELKGIKSYKESKDSKQRQEYISLETYIKHLQLYLSSGIYLDYRYGAQREGRMTEACLVPAYYADGTMKRSVGVYYPDIGMIWTKEMQEGVYDSE